LRVYNDLQQPNVKLFDCEVPGDAGPFWMTEVGLFDDGADNSNVPELMAIGGYPKTQKMDPALVGVENDYLITCAVQLTPAQDAVVSIVLNPYFHELSNHQHTGNDGTSQVDYNNLTGTEEIENSIRYLHLMDQCKRANIRETQVQCLDEWGKLASIKLKRADIPAALSGSLVYGLFFISALAQYCGSIGLKLNVGDTTVFQDDWNSPNATRHVFAQCTGEAPYDT